MVRIEGDFAGQIAIDGDITNIDKAYFGGWDAFLHKNLDELHQDMDRLTPSIQAARRAFLLHRSVPFFVISISLLAATTITLPDAKPWIEELPHPMQITVIALVFGLVAASAIWMDRSRKNIFDGLTLLRDFEKRIRTLITIREVEMKAGIRKEP